MTATKMTTVAAAVAAETGMAAANNLTCATLGGDDDSSATDAGRDHLHGHQCWTRHALVLCRWPMMQRSSPRVGSRRTAEGRTERRPPWHRRRSKRARRQGCARDAAETESLSLHSHSNDSVRSQFFSQLNLSPRNPLLICPEPVHGILHVVQRLLLFDACAARLKASSSSHVCACPLGLATCLALP